MPVVAGFLRVIKRRPWHKPGQGLPGEPGLPPDWGLEGPEVEPPDIDEGDRPPFEKPLPTPPPGVWPGPTVEHPFEPVPEEPDVPPGTIWPPVGTPEYPIQPGHKLWILVYFAGQYKYVCVDPGLLVPSPAPHLGK